MKEVTQDIMVSKVLNLDTHPSLLPQRALTYLMNGDIQGFNSTSQGTFVQNVSSNSLCYEVPGSNELLGMIKLDYDEYLLFQKTPTSSEIGILSHCTYRVVVNASCLNFNNKIEGVFKYHYGKRRAYWKEEGNPFRYIDINCPKTLKLGDCECLQQDTDELDCEALRINKIVTLPHMELEEIAGNLPNGVYQIAIAFSEKGQRVTDYYFYPQIKKYHSNQRQTFGINVNFECFKNGFDEYELVLISHRTDRTTLAQRIGYFDISQIDVSITELDETFFTPIDFGPLLTQSVNYEGAEHIAINNESLILGDLKEKPKFDYRLAATHIVSEWVALKVPKRDAHLYPQYMRDEVYPFDIQFIWPDGQLSHRTHIPSTADSAIRLVDAPLNDDHWEHEDECNPVIRKHWEIYNTATITESNDVSCVDCGAVEVARGNFGYWESKDHLYPEGWGGLECLPLRFHKFPDNKLVPIHDQGDCLGECVTILGIQFSNIPHPVDCDGNQLDIAGYIIHRGDRTNHKSILHKGLIYNVREETLSDDSKSMFSNYPFNDLYPDVFIGDSIVRQGNVFDDYDPLTSYYRDRFTYHSPDLHYIKGQTGTEIKIYSEEIGKVKGKYHYSKDYPKYQLLSPMGRLAGQLAGLIEAKLVLEGKPCNRVIAEKTCNKLVDRVTNTSDFPVNEITGTERSGGATGSILGTGPATVYTVNYTPDGGGEISSNVTQHDYSETRVGDDDCPTTYAVSNFEIDDFNGSNPIGVDNITGLESTCKAIITTNALTGTVVTFKLNDTVYNGIVAPDGKATVQINGDCQEHLTPGDADWNFGVNIQASDFEFNPECECTGDQQFTSSTQTNTCEERINLLDPKEWWKRIPTLLFYYTQGVEAVTNFLTSLIAPTDYAVQYTALAEYDGYDLTNIQPGTQRRRIDHQQYLLPIKQWVNNKKFNNWQRESSDYLELHEEIQDPANRDYTRVLLSENNCKGDFDFCSVIDSKPVQASSYYVGVKRDRPNQYGTLETYNTLKISEAQEVDGEGNYVSPVLFGGDVYISKFSVIRKMPFWEALPYDLPNNTPYDVIEYPNIGIPRFWLNVNKESIIEDAAESIPIIGNLFYDYNLDNVIKIGQCDPTLFNNIFGAFGGPGDLIDWIADLTTGIFRNPFKLPGIFYTHVVGVSSFWVESEFISDYREYNDLTNSEFYPIKAPEDLVHYQNLQLPELFLYNLQFHWNGLFKPTSTKQESSNPNQRMIYSLKSNEEGRADNWLNFRPLNYQQFGLEDGRLTAIKRIDDFNLFLTFEDGAYVTQQDEGLLTDNLNTIYLGSPNAFQRRLRKISSEDTGFGGCIDPDSIVSTRYGVFYFDRKRKKFLNYTNTLNDVTGNLQSWFNINLDSEVKGTFDNFSDNLYFSSEDWNLTFKPKAQGFVSFNSWLPEEYYTLANSFLTKKDNKLWLHNQKGYQEFYGEQHPFEVGVLLKTPNFQSSVLQSLQIYSEWYKTEGQTKLYSLDKFFNKMLVFNNFTSTGLVDLNLKNENNKMHYINQNKSKIAEVDIVEELEYRINYLTNIGVGQPLIRWEGQNYEVKNTGTPLTANIRGKFFNVHLINDKVMDHKILVQLNLGLNET